MFRYMWKIMKYTDVDTHIYVWMRARARARARVCVCVYVLQQKISIKNLSFLNKHFLLFIQDTLTNFKT